MGRISALTELTSLASDDYLVVLDSSANIAKKITVANAFGIPEFGWTAAGESWTFSSWSSTTRIGVITVPTDATTKYSEGMRVKFTQSTGGTKYGVIIARTSTTLSVFFASGITFNNEAITSPNYSLAYMPLGYTGPVLTKEAYQSDTTNSERWIFEISGWGAMTFGSAGAVISETVTLPLTTASLPIVTMTSGGDQASGTVAFGNGGNSVHGLTTVKAVSVTTTNFVVHFGQSQGSNYSSGNIVYYHWAARCPVS